MSFAICLQVPNHLHVKDYLSIWAEFIPQILFMESLFGYLVICIIYKWSTDWTAPGATQPPGLLNMLIYMFLSPGSVKPEEQLFPGQNALQVFLLLLAVVCVPWMLCIKPYLLLKEMKKHEQEGYHGISDNEHAPRTSNSQDQEEEEEGNGHALTEQMQGGGADNGEEVSSNLPHRFGPILIPISIFLFQGGHDAGEIVIHQVIHTIEFCLGTSSVSLQSSPSPSNADPSHPGCISNTASYLRLWALSLAHAQLSEVLYSMTLEGSFPQKASDAGIGSILFVFVMFAVWFVLTLAILCIMEVSVIF